YTVYFSCVDRGGNRARTSTSFSVKVDTQEPLISRVYRDGQNLKIITNEEAQCVYSLNSCSYEFETASVINYDTSGGNIVKDRHVLGWYKEQTYYIKCQDLQGKRIQGDR